MTIDQTICQPKLCMKRDGNAQSSIDVNKYGAHLMPLNHTFNLEYPLRFFTRSIFFPRLFLDFFLDIFPDFFLDLFLDNFFPTFSSTFFTTFSRLSSQISSRIFSWFLSRLFFRLSVEGGWPQSSYCCGLGEYCGLILLLQREIFLCRGTPKWSALPPCFWFCHLLWERPHAMVSDFQTTFLHCKNTRLTSWLNSKLLSSWAGVYRDLVVFCIQSWHQLKPQTVKKDFKSQRTRTNKKRQVVQAVEEHLRASGCSIGYR